MGITFNPQYVSQLDTRNDIPMYPKHVTVPVATGYNAKWTLTNFTISTGYLDASAVAPSSLASRYIPGMIQGHLQRLTVVVASVSGVNEVQTVGIDNATTSGTFTLTYDGQTTGTINWNANAAAVKSALELLSNIDLVSVTGGPGPTTDWIVEFQGTLAGQNVVAMTGDGSLLVGGSTTVTITETTPGENSAIDITWGGVTVGAINAPGTTMYRVRPIDGAPLEFKYNGANTLTASITSVIVEALDPMNLSLIPEVTPRQVD